MRAAPSLSEPERPTRVQLARRRIALRLLAVVAAAAGLAPAARAAADFGLAQLMAALGQHKSGQARFTERRHVAMLDAPLVSSGRLAFEAPDSFVRETLQPRHERITLAGNTLTIEQGQRRRTLALDTAPEAGIIVEAIRGTLTGNRAALERHFDARLSGDAALWLLELVPREGRLRAVVSSVRIAGHEGTVREVLVTLPDGDRSVMSIDPLTAAPAPRAAVAASGAAASAAR